MNKKKHQPPPSPLAVLFSVLLFGGQIARMPPLDTHRRLFSARHPPPPRRILDPHPQTNKQTSATTHLSLSSATNHNPRKTKARPLLPFSQNTTNPPPARSSPPLPPHLDLPGSLPARAASPPSPSPSTFLLFERGRGRERWRAVSFFLVLAFAPPARSRPALKGPHVFLSPGSSAP